MKVYPKSSSLNTGPPHLINLFPLNTLQSADIFVSFVSFCFPEPCFTRELLFSLKWLRWCHAIHWRPQGACPVLKSLSPLLPPWAAPEPWAGWFPRGSRWKDGGCILYKSPIIIATHIYNILELACHIETSLGAWVRGTEILFRKYSKEKKRKILTFSERPYKRWLSSVYKRKPLLKADLGSVRMYKSPLCCHEVHFTALHVSHVMSYHILSSAKSCVLLSDNVHNTVFKL